MMPLPPGPFGLIYADPPWHFETWSLRGRNRCPDWRQEEGQPRHYETMSFWDIAELPVAEIADRDSVLLLWTTDSMLCRAIDVGHAWGFRFKTVGFYWVKRTKDGKRWAFGMGHWTRSNPEQCLLFTRGKPKRRSAAVRKLIEAPVREHSRKPDEAYERIEQLVDGPYLELFARHRRPGWTVWGDQLPEPGEDE